MPLNIEGYEIRDRDVRLYEQTSIVRSGLVLNLDASIFNTVTYGATWFDISGNGNNGTMVNGPTYNSGNGGSLVFDGVNDYVNGNTNITIGNAITITAYIKHNAITTGQKRYVTLVEEVAVIRQNFSAGELHFYITTSGTIKQQTVSNYLQANNWYYIVGVWDGTTMSLYGNGVLLTSSTPGGIMSSTTNYLLGGTPSAEFMNGNIAQVSIYNRALSAAEVLHNYNVTKGRFGL